MSIWWDLKEHLGEQRSVKAGLKGAYVRLRDAGQGPDKYVIRKVSRPGLRLGTRSAAVPLSLSAHFHATGLSQVGAMMLLEPQQGSAGQGRDQEHPSVSRVRLQISEGMARLLQLSQSWPQQEELEAFQVAWKLLPSSLPTLRPKPPHVIYLCSSVLPSACASVKVSRKCAALLNATCCSAAA